jgi:hypothetical protein
MEGGAPARLGFLVVEHTSGKAGTRKRRRTMTKKLTAEFLGTAWLVFGGCGSAVLAAAFPNVGIGLLASPSPSVSPF